ncbi:MAG: ACT domain-containing protein [Geminicoccaceae bacterium]
MPQGIAFQLAGCCRPVPGDAIVGVVRTGRPVSVHLAECRNVAQMDAESSRFVDVGWGAIDPEAYAAARLSVMVLNRPGALGTVSTIIGKQNGNITDVRIGRRVNDLYEMVLDVEVVDAEQLLRIKAALRASDIVVSVERVQS